MDNFLLCLNAILPLLLLMLLGYGLRRSGMISHEGFSAMDKLCFRILIPAMLFSNVYHADFHSDLYPQAIVFMWLAMLATFLLAFFLIPQLIHGEKAEVATVIHGLCHGNLAVLGMPLMLNLFDADAVVVYSILMACSSPLINPLMVFEHVYFQGEKVEPLRLLRNIMTSPFLVGTLLGMFCNLIGLHFPVFLETTIANLKSIASPLCLIALGGSFSFGSIRGSFREVAGVVLARCFVLPAMILGFAVLLGFRGVALASLLVIFACPSAAATYSFCTGYCGDPELASQLVVYTTVFSIFSMFCWLFLFLQLGLF